MSKPMNIRFFVAFSDRVVMTDDPATVDAELMVTAFTVMTRRSANIFAGAMDEGGDAKFAATRWVGNYLPSGVFTVRVWRDFRGRDEGEPEDIVSFAPGVWRTVDGNYDVVLKNDVAGDEPDPTKAG
jgi:hypothetical protein